MTMARNKPLFANRQTALICGWAGILLGSYALYDAYEKRGRKRPFVTKFAPGP
jgi:hypothetical protein